MYGSDQKFSHLSCGEKRDGAGWVTDKGPETEKKFKLAFLVFQITYEIFHYNTGSAKIQSPNLF